MNPKKVAVILDGGFIKKQLYAQNNRLTSASDIVKLTQDILKDKKLDGTELFRAYYYDAMPHGEKEANPFDGVITDFKKTSAYQTNTTLIQSLELTEHFAVRKGELAFRGWKLNKYSIDKIKNNNNIITPKDIVINLSQKGVDIKIGLDIAWLSIKKIVDIIVLVTGDSDFVAAMKLARKEGIKIALVPLGHLSIRREMRVHSDLILDSYGPRPTSQPRRRRPLRRGP